MMNQLTARIADDADVAVKLRSEDVLRRLWLLREAEGRVEGWLGEAIIDAREAGRTWDEIGQALGVTRQAAWQRYRDRMRADLDGRGATTPFRARRAAGRWSSTGGRANRRSSERTR